MAEPEGSIVVSSVLACTTAKRGSITDASTTEGSIAVSRTIVRPMVAVVFQILVRTTAPYVPIVR